MNGPLTPLALPLTADVVYVDSPLMSLSQDNDQIFTRVFLKFEILTNFRCSLRP